MTHNDVMTKMSRLVESNIGQTSISSILCRYFLSKNLKSEGNSATSLSNLEETCWTGRQFSLNPIKLASSLRFGKCTMLCLHRSVKPMSRFSERPMLFPTFVRLYLTSQNSGFTNLCKWSDTRLLQGCRKSYGRPLTYHFIVSHRMKNNSLLILAGCSLQWHGLNDN